MYCMGVDIVKCKIVVSLRSQAPLLFYSLEYYINLYFLRLIIIFFIILLDKGIYGYDIVFTMQISLGTILKDHNKVISLYEKTHNNQVPKFMNETKSHQD